MGKYYSMNISLQIKLFAMCVLLVALTAAGILVTSYVMIKKDKERESFERLQIAFEIIRDDYLHRKENYPAKIEDFQDKDVSIPWLTSSYFREGDEYFSALSSLSTLGRTAEEFKKFGRAVSIDRLLLYGADKRLLVAYHRTGNEERVGAYAISAGGNDTYLPLDEYQKLAKILTDHEPIPDVSLPEGIPSFFDGELPGKTEVFPISDGFQLGLMAAVPILYNKETVGVLVGQVFYTQQVLERYALLSKADFSFFSSSGLSASTLALQTTLDIETLRALPSCESILEKGEPIHVASVTMEEQDFYQAGCAFRDAGEPFGAITVNLSQEFEKQGARKILSAVFAVSGLSCIVAFLLSLLASRKTIAAIHNIVYVIGAAAKGDLRQSAGMYSHDEIGMLGMKLNQMIQQLRSISGQVQGAASTVNNTAETLFREMSELIRHMEQQAGSVEDTTLSFDKVMHFIDTVAQNTTTLLSASSEILTSIQQTRASIGEVTKSTTSLSTDLLLISSSVEQVNEAVRQVSGNTEQLEGIARQTEREVQRIDDSYQDVSRNAELTQELAQDTMEAVTLGQESVDSSMQGMHELKDVVSNTAQIMQEISSWGEQVSSILGIVDEITEQTALLSLNASIISAQAGSHGKGFAVVADEIKDLATRTKSSTQEIGTLVHKLQKKTEEGVKQSYEGLAKADYGVVLAKAVKEALNTILERASRSSSGAANTTQIIQGTVESSRIISGSMKSVTEMVSEIRTSLQEREQDIDQVLSAVENISEMAEQVSHSSHEQNNAANHIAKSMEEATGEFEVISEQAEELKRSSQQIVDAMHAIELVTGHILEKATNVSQETVSNLMQQSEELQKSIRIFKLSK